MVRLHRIQCVDMCTRLRPEPHLYWRPVAYWKSQNGLSYDFLSLRSLSCCIYSAIVKFSIAFISGVISSLIYAYHPVSDCLRCIKVACAYTENVFASICIATRTLRELYPELSQLLDARVVSANIYQRNALTPKELESIQSLKDRPIAAAETLLNIILEQSDAVYLCFLDVLKQTGQQHIYRRLVEGAYEGGDVNCNSLYVYKKLQGCRLSLNVAK